MIDTEILDAGSPEGAPEVSHADPLDAILNDAVDKAFAETVDGDQPSEAATTTDARARDVQGRFARPDAASKEPAAPNAPQAASQTPAQPAVPTALEAPARWNEADKASFKALPPEAQKILVDRNTAMEADYTRKTQEIAAYRASADPLVQAVQPHADYLQRLGMPPAQAVTALLTTERALRVGSPQQKVQALAKIAADYGIPLGAVTAGAPGQPSPLQQHHQQQNSDVDRRLRQIEAERQQERQQQQVQQHQQTVSHIDAFTQAKDEQGQPKYPHFDAVRGIMAQLIQNGKATGLEDAYALAAKPIEDRIAAALGERHASVDQTRQQQLDRAKRAAPVKTLPAKGAARPQTLDDIVSASLDRAGF